MASTAGQEVLKNMGLLYETPLATSLSSASEVHEEHEEEYIEADPTRYGFHEVTIGELEPITTIVSRPNLSRVGTQLSTASTRSVDPAFEVDFVDNDPEDPKNMPTWRKVMAIFSCALATVTIVLASSAYTSGLPGMMIDLHVANETTALFGLTTYLLGLACGALICAPLSEMMGRRPIYLGSIAIYIVLVIPCAQAKNIGTVLVVRFLAALAGCSTISNSPGTINDIMSEDKRTLAYSVWSIGPMNGPVLGPIIGGFVVQYLDWRWIYYIIIMLSGVSFLLLLAVKETYAPSILRARAHRLRKETGDSRYWSRYDEKQGVWHVLRTSLWRPFAMTFTEPILWFWDFYISIVYSILYLSFVAYPIIFQDERHWSSGISGLAFVGIGIGTLTTIFSEPFIRRMINMHKPDPETGHPPPEAMVSVICIGAILVPIGELWFAWTCTPNVHWIWPILAGIPFGAGNGTVFIYGSNYVVHSYGMYAASALAGNTFFRSALGGLLPLAGPAMYATLGPHWAGTMLGLLELLCLPIPFIFYKYGHKIRMKSKLIRSMQHDKQKLEAKRARALKKVDRMAELEKGPT